MGAPVSAATLSAGGATTNDAGSPGGAISAAAGEAGDAFESPPTSVQAPDNSTNGSATTLTVLTYNDIQTAASNPTVMGRLEGTINERKAAHENPTVVVGGGDQVSPSSLSPVSNWTVPIKALNVIDPAAEVVGNHDLDFGFDAVKNFTAESEFPWLVANIQKTGTDGENIPGTKDYTIVERNGVKIGIIGLVDEAIKGKTAVDFAEKGYEVTDFVDVGSRIATKLKNEKNVDVVIAAAHIGIPESKELARNSNNIDMIVVGDDELKYPPQVTSDTVIVEGQARAAYLGEVNLTVTENDVTFDSGRLKTVAENGNATVNQTVYDIVNESRGRFLSKVAGSTEVTLDSTFASNYAEDTIWGNLITDAFRAKTGAEVAITNAGGIRGNFVMKPGQITYNDIYTSLPFGNYLVTKEMTGRQLKELLASQVTRLDAEFGGQAQLQVSGVSYEFVDRPGADAEVMELFVNGQPVRMDETYTVTVNSFMAGWDRISKMPTVSENFVLYGTATLDYIQKNSPIDREGKNRIRRVSRTVGESAVDLSGDTATLTYDVPSQVGSIDPSSFQISNEEGDTLSATDASLSGNTLTVEFDADDYQSLEARSDTLELYGTYNDTELDANRNGFSQSALNGEIIESGSVVNVIWGDDRQLSDEEFQTAINYWVSGSAVPGTDGAVVSDRLLQIIIQKWVTSGS